MKKESHSRNGSHAVTYLGLGGGANFRWPLVLTQRGKGKPSFPKTNFLPKGPWPNDPPKYATVHANWNNYEFYDLPSPSINEATGTVVLTWGEFFCTYWFNVSIKLCILWKHPYPRQDFICNDLGQATRAKFPALSHTECSHFYYSTPTLVAQFSHLLAYSCHFCYQLSIERHLIFLYPYTLYPTSTNPISMLSEYRPAWIRSASDLSVENVTWKSNPEAYIPFQGSFTKAPSWRNWIEEETSWWHPYWMVVWRLWPSNCPYLTESRTWMWLKYRSRKHPMNGRSLRKPGRIFESQSGNVYDVEWNAALWPCMGKN